ncbi:MAG: hypothetical protein JXK05_07780 [Campylobacterales bacterium]|nr:hypothetical protein [Campylobacterales bacterium]
MSGIRKQELINDISTLLNSYQDVGTTYINPALLEFMDDEILKSIIADLLQQKEHQQESNREWLEQFKTLQN